MVRAIPPVTVQPLRHRQIRGSETKLLPPFLPVFATTLMRDAILNHFGCQVSPDQDTLSSYVNGNIIEGQVDRNYSRYNGDSPPYVVQRVQTVSHTEDQ